MRGAAQNLDAGRAFLSPGAYFTWRAQLETLAAEGRRNVMEHLSVQRIDPVQIVHGRVFDDLTVRVSASAADFEVDKDNRIVFGDRTVRPFTEDWTFQRSVGVATTQKPGTLENTCPSCGAPIALNQIGECRYCRRRSPAANSTGWYRASNKIRTPRALRTKKDPSAPDATLRCRSAAPSSEGCWPACCRIEDRTIRTIGTEAGRRASGLVRIARP